MRSVSSILIAFGILSAFTSVEAIFRPGYGGGHRPPPSYYHGGGGGGGDDCETPKPTTTVAPTTTAVPTTTAAPTTPVPELSCPAGFKKYTRVPAADNLFTSAWCMMAVFQQAPIKIEEAGALCATKGASLTILGSAVEQTEFAAELKTYLQSIGHDTGAIAVDGRRIANCSSRDRGTLDSEACNGQNAFKLQQGNTAPGFPWSIWAQTEPSANAWTYDIEECIQFAVDPYNLNRTALLNDFYCNMNVAPNDPENPVYWNFGALCGVAPS
uniref:C-type lectin domain-containing protein n=1 Tax=Caenorhabditis tropicalis TaxID=1561998 RepID=A0A1I7TSS6_9PELO